MGKYEGTTGPHQPSYDSFERSVTEDCYICCYIWSQALKDEKFHSDTTRSPYTDFTVKLGWHSESRNLDFRFTGSTGVISFLLFPSSSVASMESS
jgi:hypothetical protein